MGGRGSRILFLFLTNGCLSQGTQYGFQIYRKLWQFSVVNDTAMRDSLLILPSVDVLNRRIIQYALIVTNKRDQIIIHCDIEVIAY